MKHIEFQLACGSSIRMTSLAQRLTYGGLLEGLPLRRMNDRMVETLARRAHVVHAPQKEIELDQPRPLGSSAALPPIQCEAEFVGPGFSDTMLRRSHLTVARFQDDWALPLDDAARAAIEAMDWRSLAREREL